MEALGLKLGSAFLLSLLGSPHCLGMCGGFALGFGAKSRGVGQRLLRQLMWSSGRTFTYVFMGMVAGASGAALAASGWLGSMQAAAGYVAGAVMVVLGLFHLGVLRLPAARPGAPLSGFSRLVGGLRMSRRPWAPFGVGVLTGFIPCGMVYAAAVMASTTGSVPEAALVMLAFGLGTFPALAALGMAGVAVRARTRFNFQRLAGALTVVLGILFLLRAPVGLSEEAEPDCPMCDVMPTEAPTMAGGAP